VPRIPSADPHPSPGATCPREEHIDENPTMRGPSEHAYAHV